MVTPAHGDTGMHRNLDKHKGHLQKDLPWALLSSFAGGVKAKAAFLRNSGVSLTGIATKLFIIIIIYVYSLFYLHFIDIRIFFSCAVPSLHSYQISSPLSLGLL